MGDIYKDGKKQSTKPPEPPTRLAIINTFAGIADLRLSLLVHYIYSNYTVDLERLPCLDELEKLIDDFFQLAQVIYESKFKVTPKTRSDVAAMKKAIDEFRSLIESFYGYEPQTNKAFVSDLDELAGQLHTFVFQFDATCDLLWASKALPFRPTDRDLKKRFLDAVIYYCDERKTEKFPPYFWVLKHLKLPDKKLSQKTYGLWKKQMKDGVFHLALLPKNRQ